MNPIKSVNIVSDPRNSSVQNGLKKNRVLGGGLHKINLGSRTIINEMVILNLDKIKIDFE